MSSTEQVTFAPWPLNRMAVAVRAVRPPVSRPPPAGVASPPDTCTLLTAPLGLHTPLPVSLVTVLPPLPSASCTSRPRLLPMVSTPASCARLLRMHDMANLTGTSALCLLALRPAWLCAPCPRMPWPVTLHMSACQGAPRQIALPSLGLTLGPCLEPCLPTLHASSSSSSCAAHSGTPRSYLP
jgi:hypothetical protein